MVRIEEKSLEERTRDERYNRLVELLQEELNNQTQYTINTLSTCTIIIWDENKRKSALLIDVGDNKIYVYKPEYESLGLQVAESYEKDIRKEVTLKKEF